MKILIISLSLILATLQYKLWFAADGIRSYLSLKHDIVQQQQENSQLTLRNQALIDEINNLKKGKDAIEEHARNNLGMIKKGETFYQVIN